MTARTSASAGRAPGRGTYFFLSYAHTPPAVYEPTAVERPPDADETVGLFFKDLSAAVGEAAATGPAAPDRPPLDPGFCDRALASGADWTAEVDAALGRAEVFVPLYAPRYFASTWAGREWARFFLRLRGQGVAQPERRVVPVLWTPLPPGFHNPTGVEAPADHTSIPGYLDDGLEALRRLTRRRPQYEQAVAAVATTVVRVARELRIGPGRVPADGGALPFPADDADPRLELLVAAPAPHDGSEPVRAWRPFGDSQRLALADYAQTVAARLGFACRARPLTQKAEGLAHAPGVVLIDTRLAADPAGRALVETALPYLPAWAVVALVTPDPPGDAHARWPRLHACAHGDGPRHAVHEFRTLEEFDAAFPILVTDAASLYLRLAPRGAEDGAPDGTARPLPYFGRPGSD